MEFTKSQAYSELLQRGFFLHERLPQEYLQAVIHGTKRPPMQKHIIHPDSAIAKICPTKPLFDSMMLQPCFTDSFPFEYSSRLNGFYTTCVNSWSGQAFELALMSAIENKRDVDAGMKSLIREMEVEEVPNHELSEISRKRQTFNQSLARRSVKKGVSLTKTKIENEAHNELIRMAKG